MPEFCSPFTGLASDRKLKHDEKRESLETIDKNTDRLVELIEQLLDMSRLDISLPGDR